MIGTALVTLISFFIPATAEVFLAEGSVYAEYRQADMTVSIFDEALAMRA